MSVDIIPTRLFRVVTPQVAWPEFGPPFTIESGALLWQHSNRRSSLGGYIGTFTRTYHSAVGRVFPSPGSSFKLHHDHVCPVH